MMFFSHFLDESCSLVSMISIVLWYLVFSFLMTIRSTRDYTLKEYCEFFFRTVEDCGSVTIRGGVVWGGDTSPTHSNMPFHNYDQGLNEDFINLASLSHIYDHGLNKDVTNLTSQSRPYPMLGCYQTC